MMTKDRRRRLMLLIICMLVAAVTAFAYIASGTSGLKTDEAKDYIAEHHEEDTAAQNAVTAVYLNYRYWDTLFESLILLVSALAVISLSWNAGKPK